MRIVRLLAIALLAFRAEAADPLVSTGVVTRVWQSQDGLPSNVVRSVVQATEGHIWVATAEGVARFNGYEFELIEPEGDLRRYRLAFSRLFTTSRGEVWAATYQGGLFRVRGGVLVKILDNTRSPRPPIVTQVVEDERGDVFFMRGAEIGRIRNSGEVEPLEADDALRRLFADDLNRKLERGQVFEPGATPSLRDRDGRIWSASVSGGLTVTDGDRAGVAVVFPQRGLAFGVNEMLLDREGNVWVASPVNGLARVRPARVDLPEVNGSEGERSFSALLQEKSGAWWVADRRGGLVRWTQEESRHMDFSPTRHYRPAAALFEDKESRLWVASRDGSVFLEENGGFEPQFVKSQTPSKVRAITQDGNGTLWFGGTQGLASLAGGTVRTYGKADGVADVDVTVMQPYGDGRILAGTSNGRILLGNERGFQSIAGPEVTNHQWISGILASSPAEVWVSTLGSGLFLWNGKTWRGFGPNDGLPDHRLTCVLGDGGNNLWLGSLGGIIRAEREELLARITDPDVAVHWLRLDHTDGLPSRECIGGFQPAGWRGNDGTLWFPTGGGVVRVWPGLVRPNREAPPVFLQSVRSNGVLHTDERGPITTEPGRARLEFRFVGLSFSAPEKTSYRARLAGLDETWRELGNQRVAAFEAVPPGRYTFEVMAVNGDGVRSITPARIQVVVTPRFWQTAWFYLTAGAAVLSAAAGTGWFGARLRMRRRIQSLKIRSARETERSRIARDLHDDLGASLTEISILAALAAEDAEKTPLQPSLEQLSAKAKHVVSSLDEIVWAVNPREDNLPSLVEYLAAFAREFLDIARIPLRVDMATEIPDHPLAASQRHGVFLAAREALNNIVKHSGATEVHLSVAIGEGELRMTLADNGKGFSPDYATGGNGLGNLRLRMQEAGGDCRIDTRLGEGTTVLLSLPLQPPAKTAP